MAKKSDVKVPISERALVQRINRKLADEGQLVKKARERVATTLGDYFVVDLTSNAVMDQDVDLEKLGRELKVLHDYETVA